MLPSACAGKCSQSVAIRLGHCYIQFVANQVSAADCPHCPLTVCRLRCALTELDLIYCARTRTSVLVCTCIAELVVPLGKAQAIDRAWISWVNSNFIFSFPDGSSPHRSEGAPGGGEGGGGERRGEAASPQPSRASASVQGLPEGRPP